MPQGGPGLARQSTNASTSLSGHEEANFLESCAFRLKYAHERPLEDHRNPVRQGQNVVKLLGRQKDRKAFRTFFEQRLVNIFDHADVEPARGLIGEQATCTGPELAGKNDLLGISAGERAGWRFRRLGDYSKFLDRIAREGANG